MFTLKSLPGERNTVVGNKSGLLSLSQRARVIAIGLTFWFAAALTVRFGASFFGPGASIVTFALTIPACWLAVRWIKKLAGLDAGQVVPGVALGTIAAALCDGLALTWVRGLYGSDPAIIVFGAAWILWGVGLFLLFALLEDQRQARANRAL